MKMKDFISSSKRHKKFCEEIINKNLFPKENLHNSSPVVNLYYLSGYIIECILKYAILLCLRYDKDKEVTELSTRRCKFEDLRTHRLLRLYEIFRQIAGYNIKEIEKNRNLLAEWTSDARYTVGNINLDFEKIQKFYETANQIFKVIDQKLKGVR